MIQTETTVVTPRMTFHCRIWGQDDGIPVLLLHGSYGTSRWWEGFATSLPEEIFSFAPDLRGCGKSSKTDGGYSIVEQAEDVESLVGALGWDDFNLVAHSSSGAIAVEYALKNPGKLSTLMLVDTVPVEGVFTPIDGYMVLEQMRTDRALLAEAMALLMPRLAAAVQRGETAESVLFETLVDDALDMAPAAFVDVARSLSQWNRFADARQLTLPTLLVWGDQDVIVDRESTTRTLIAIPGANNLEVMHGVGHSPLLEAPQRLAEIYVNFITQDFAGFDAIRDSA
ncbi:MAG: alpha/beta hydrolase [Caldilineaceae bacterium]